jgi:hypothetical protein
MEADIRLLRATAGQFLMGAMMGALFVGVIMLANAKIVAAIVDGSPFPIATTVIVFAGPMLYFAFGAAITGFLFLVSENAPDEPDRGVSSRMHAITQCAAVDAGPKRHQQVFRRDDRARRPCRTNSQGGGRPGHRQRHHRGLLDR